MGQNKLPNWATSEYRNHKIVLTSNDPQYHAKLGVIKQILSDLKENEAFFSIDEYGPFAIKRKGVGGELVRTRSMWSLRIKSRKAG